MFFKVTILSLFSHSHFQLFVTPWTAICQASLSFTISHSLLKFMCTESRMQSNHLILYHSLLFLASIVASSRVFPNESTLLIRWPKYWSFSFSIHPSNEYSGLISFKIDWFDLPAVQGTLKSLLCTIQKRQLLGAQTSWSNSHIVHDSWEKPQLWPDAPLSAKWCLCFLIHCLGFHSFSSKEQVYFNFMAAVPICSDSGAQENKVSHCSHFSSSFCHEGMRSDHDFKQKLSAPPPKPRIWKSNSHLWRSPRSHDMISFT